MLPASACVDKNIGLPSMSLQCQIEGIKIAISKAILFYKQNVLTPYLEDQQRLFQLQHALTLVSQTSQAASPSHSPAMNAAVASGSVSSLSSPLVSSPALSASVGDLAAAVPGLMVNHVNVAQIDTQSTGAQMFSLLSQSLPSVLQPAQMNNNHNHNDISQSEGDYGVGNVSISSSDSDAHVPVSTTTSTSLPQPTESEGSDDPDVSDLTDQFGGFGSTDHHGNQSNHTVTSTTQVQSNENESTGVISTMLSAQMNVHETESVTERNDEDIIIRGPFQ